jgi:hypothetical protein
MKLFASSKEEEKKDEKNPKRKSSSQMPLRDKCMVSTSASKCLQQIKF